MEKAEKAINEQGDMTECVEMLRAAAEEFPSEPQVLIKLGYAFSLHGWKKNGARSYTTNDSDCAHEDTEYNSGNVYWQEEVRVAERYCFLRKSEYSGYCAMISDMIRFSNFFVCHSAPFLFGNWENEIQCFGTE